MFIDHRRTVTFSAEQCCRQRSVFEYCVMGFIICLALYVNILAASSNASPQVVDGLGDISAHPLEDLKEAVENLDGSNQPSYVAIESAQEGIEDATQVIAEDRARGDVQTTEEIVSLQSDNSTLNGTNVETANNTGEVKNTSAILITCATVQDAIAQPVELVNSTRLVSILTINFNITNRRTPANCAIVLFYARFCPFSSMAAPHFNALPRAYPSIKMVAVDAMKFHSFNTQYGIVGVPTLMLFRNGRPAAKFNESEYTLEAFSKFVNKYTGFEPHSMLFVKSADFIGPVSSIPTKETDYCLVLSWMFIIVCVVYFFSKSSWWRWIVEAVQNTWRESEAQHEHDD